MSKADELYQRALKVMPGGVTASARVNKALGRPLHIDHGAGSKVYDLDGHEYVDMCTSFGASLLGHGHPRIKEAIVQAAEIGIICA
jgi:glutamate-1-semialdehyde 2,1-aminomutase